MGDISTSSDPKVAAAEMFSQFKSHCSGQRVHTHLVLTEALRSTYPDCNIISITHSSCDLQGYVAAGHATSTPLSIEDSNLTDLVYRAPASRIDENPGKLSESVEFASHQVSWQNDSWIVYTAKWRDEMFGRVKMYYYLQPKVSAKSTLESFLLAASKWTSDVHDEVYVFDDGCWMKNKKLWQAVQNASWEDVILDPDMKDTLIADVQNFFDSRAVYEEYSVPWKRGIILHGTPGCGKTISIKALMNSLGKRPEHVASLYVKSLKSDCGTLQFSIRSIFDKAREMAPCLLVLEDLDSLVVDEVRSYFLNEVDGLEENNGILMIGSTNHLDRLDPGISKRPSRFDRKYFYQLPGKRERVLYCEYWRAKLEKNSKIDFDPAICEVVAELTQGFSFAYLKELFVQTLLTIVGGRQSDVDEDEVVEEVTASEAKGDEGTSAEETTKSPEQWIPIVDIPPHLESNSLMRVLRKQAVALWKDMDNSRDKEAAAAKVA